MPFTQFTNLDFDEIKAQIKDFIRSNSNFSGFDFEGSNFSVLIDTLAYNTYTHQFDPYGVSCTVSLAESHLCCHTWPEKQCVAIDIFTCGAKNPRCVGWWILKYFDSDDYVMNDYAR